MSEIGKAFIFGLIIAIISSILTIIILYSSLEVRAEEKYNKMLLQIEQQEKKELEQENKLDKTVAITLAEKNNNPLNIKANNWLGQTGIDEFGHAQFINNEYGIRAAASVLINYSYKHKISNVYDIVHRFCTGNQKEYIAFICKRMDLTPHQDFDILARLPELLQTMARFESGKEWSYTYFIPYSLTKNIFNKGVNQQ